MFSFRKLIEQTACGLVRKCRFPQLFSMNCESLRGLTTKQIVYKEWGDPAKVLKMTTKELDKDLTTSQVLVRWLASPINPADINQIQGVYPVKPPLPAVGGNEGVGVVEKFGTQVGSLKVGDHVIPTRSGLGTWTQYGVYETSELYQIDKNLSDVNAAMLQVNPSTAYRLLKDFVQLAPGDCIVQNGANSAVGRYVIQICRIWKLKLINVVRDRGTIDELKTELQKLGAEVVFTEEEFVKASRGLKNIKLALNCVSGRSSLMLARCLAKDGCLVTYGGMSKQPVQVPTGALIFNDITLRGFWMSRWYSDEANSEKRKKMYKELSDYMKNGKLKEPPIVTHKFGENFAKAFDETNLKSKKHLLIF